MADWNSLYLPSADSAALIETLRATLREPAYLPYDPFGMMPVTKAYERAVRLFVSPPRDGWTRIAGAPEAPADDAICRALSQHVPVFSAALIGGEAQIKVYQDGAPVDAAAALAAYGSAEDVQRALTPPVPDRRGKLPLVVPEEALPKVQKIKTDQFGFLANRLAGKALKPHEKQAAGAFLNDVVVDWASAAGQQIVALLLLLNVPAWSEPDYAALRDAYALHRRRQRNPNARLLPGDDSTLEAVPDALQWTPFFAGVA